MFEDFVTIIIDFNAMKVVFDIPDTVEAAGYSTAMKEKLNGFKNDGLGKALQYDINSDIESNIEIFKTIY